MPGVVALGYVVASVTDLDKWVTFGNQLLGLQIAERTDERVRLRTDAYSYRFDLRRADYDAVTTLGWEVTGPAELADLADRLASAGYPIEQGSAELIAERAVTDLLSFTDHDGLTLELFYGLQTDEEVFVSPTGANFVTGNGGLGHVLQLVSDPVETLSLYLDILGFRLTDHVGAPGGPLATFLHCNQRHHSFAFASIPNGPTGVQHLMVEVDDIDVVGRAWDKIQAGAAPIGSSLGRHSNDQMLSFYAHTPSGFLQMEYGFGGKIIGPDHRPTRFRHGDIWGHQRADPSLPDV